jgi:hypothetical protein
MLFGLLREKVVPRVARAHTMAAPNLTMPWQRLPLRKIALPKKDWLSSHVEEAKKRFTSAMKQNVLVPMPMIIFGVFCVNGTIQLYLGSGKDFFHHSYVTKKNPDDLVEFYQAEDLLKIIAGHPIFFKLFMDKVQVGPTPETDKDAMLSVEESRMDVKTLGMEVSFVITDEEEEVDGENIRHFKRYERFTDFVPLLNEWGHKFLLWDQIWTYGMKCRPDGTTEIYHHGHDFYGPWPIRLIIWAHQRYVIWACERLINSPAFGTEDDDYWSEKMDQMMDCMPKVALQSATFGRERTSSKSAIKGTGMRITIGPDGRWHHEVYAGAEE